VLGLSATALGVLPQEEGTVDLLTQANVQLEGAFNMDQSGDAVAPAGDVNGDGIDDVIVGAYWSRLTRGTSHVVFGSASSASVNLAAMGSRGFTITGARRFESSPYYSGDQLGTSVAAAGDVNGDGFDDVIVGAPGDWRNSPGYAYVVYGSASPAAVNLTTAADAGLGSRGFAINGAAVRDELGASVAGAGDVNGDGLDDVIVGAPEKNLTVGQLIPTNPSATYVIYGSASAPGPVNLTGAADAGLGSRGFAINPAASGGQLGASVAGAGDVNGDGRDDLVVGAPGAQTGPYLGLAGITYVIFGSASPSTVNLTSAADAGLGPGAGFAIRGSYYADFTGDVVDGAGDVNGDGFDDVVVGAGSASQRGQNHVQGDAWGVIYVIYGSASPAPVNLTNAVDAGLGSRGFSINGSAAGECLGEAVAGAGDVNSDGLDDLVVGLKRRSPGSPPRPYAGTSYVIYGSAATPSPMDLAQPLGSRGITVMGAKGDPNPQGNSGDRSGASVAGAGDFNGDGRDDVLVGAIDANPDPTRGGAGVTYVVYGFGTAAMSYPAGITATAGTQVTPLAPTLSRTGVPSFTVSPALPAGLSIGATTGVISGTPTAASADASYTVTMTDLTGQVSNTVKIAVAPGPPAATSVAPVTPVGPAGKLRMARARQGSRGVVTTGVVPAGATSVVQLATRRSPRAGQQVPGMREAARRAAPCSIRGTGSARTFTCTMRLAPGQWTLTTRARGGGVVLAQSVTRVGVKARGARTVPVAG
jgi:glycosylphosphatidylinositol phospholipase D